jgi:hypothetical protein
MRALLEDGPMQGRTLEVEPLEGRPPKTIDVLDEHGVAESATHGFLGTPA